MNWCFAEVVIYLFLAQYGIVRSWCMRLIPVEIFRRNRIDYSDVIVLEVEPLCSYSLGEVIP